VLVGDLVLVAVGDMVPADGFLIESLGLKVDEDLCVRGHDPDDVLTEYI
jgi:magnesium-transporting ATPase (P-type)